MKPSYVIKAIKVAFRAGHPIMLYGPPGIGKSDLVRQACQDEGYDITDIRVSQMDPVDIRGIPMISTDDMITRFSKSAWWPKNNHTCLFWDEITSGAQAVMAASYQILLDKMLGEHKLPEGTVQVGAGNNLGDGGIVNVMPTPLKNRFLHVDVDVDEEEWCQWAMKNNVRSEVISLIRFKPTLLNEFGRVNQITVDGQEKKSRVSHKDLKAFATPRTWMFCSDIMNANPDPDIALAMYAGTVGEAAAIELRTHMAIHATLPNFDEIIKNPKRAPVPDKDEAAIQYSLATSLATKATVKNLKPILEYSKRIPTEFAVMLVRDIVMRDKNLANMAEFNEWAEQHQNILF